MLGKWLKKIGVSLLLATTLVVGSGAFVELPEAGSAIVAPIELGAEVAQATSGVDTTNSRTNETPGAAADTTQTQAEQLFERAINNFAAMISLVLLFLSYLLWPVLVLIGALMDSELIMGGGMEDRLLSIWSQIRNLVNLGFVVALVGIALYNVLGLDSDGNYAIKKILPKFVIGLILVNFSFFACKVVLDAANVATTAMFALPNSVESSFKQNQADALAQQICGTIDKISSGGITFTDEKGKSDTVDVSGIQDSLCLDNKTFTASARTFFQRFSHNNMALVMAVQFGQIHKYMDTSALVREKPSIANLAINLLFSAAMFVVYVSAFIALLAVLLARLVVLWIVIALSPLAALTVVLPEGFGSNDFDVKDMFIKHVIAPIKIGFGMSVGYIMLGALQQVGPDSLNFSLGQQFIAPFSGLSTMQEVIVAVATIGVVWKVTFSAADDTLASGITSSIQRWVEDQGRLVASLPLYVQGIPTPSAKGGSNNQSIRSLLNKGSAGNLQRMLESSSEEKPPETGGGSIANSTEFVTKVNRGSWSESEARSLLSHSLNETAWKERQLTVGAMRSLMKTAGIDDGIIKAHFPESMGDREQVDRVMQHGRKGFTDLQEALRGKGISSLPFTAKANK